MRIFGLRSTKFDEFGLRRTMGDQMVPLLVAAAMGFLAELAITGWLGAAVVARYWEAGAGSTFTVQVPKAGLLDAGGSTTQLAAVQALLATAHGVELVRTLSDSQLNRLLQPWLGENMKELAIPVPAVISVRMTGEPRDLPALAAALGRAAPGTTIESHAAWAARLTALARGLQACSVLALLFVASVTAAVIAVATRSGIAQRRETIQIIHQLGATDGYIARRFGNRSAALASIGGAIGGLFALPLILMLTALAAPLIGGNFDALNARDLLAHLTVRLWTLPFILALAAAGVGYLAAYVMVRQWLHRLP